MGKAVPHARAEVVLRVPLDDPWLYDMKKLRSRADQFDNEMEISLDVFEDALRSKDGFGRTDWTIRSIHWHRWMNSMPVPSMAR